MDGQIVEKEETDCNIGVFWDLFILTFFNQSCWSLLFVTLNVTLGKHILSPRTNVLTYFSDVWLDGAKIAKKHVCDCLIPRGPSLSMKICAQREAGRRKPPRRRFSSLLSPSHGPSRFVTSHSRFALAFVRKTKRLRRRQCLRHVSGKLPTYPFHVILSFFLLSTPGQRGQNTGKERVGPPGPPGSPGPTGLPGPSGPKGTQWNILS